MKPEDLELIEAYLEGSLSAEQRAGFEQRLSEDEALQKELKLVQELEQIHDPEFEAFRSNLIKADSETRLDKSTTSVEGAASMSDTESTEKKVAKVRTLQTRRIWLAAATIIVILAGAYLFNTFSGSQNPAQMLAQSYEQYETPAASRSSETELEKLKRQGFDAYNDGDYEESFNRLLLASEIDSKDMDIAFFLALSLSRQAEKSPSRQKLLDSARPLFRSVVDHSSSIWADDASWCLALLEWENGKEELASELLSGLLNSDRYGARAAKAIKRLEAQGN